MLASLQSDDVHDTRDPQEPPWKKLKLSLEEPYKDDNGKPIPVLLDITPEGELVHEPGVNHLQEVGEDLRRLFVERGLDFFEKRQSEVKTGHEDTTNEDAAHQKGMALVLTAQDLFKMRADIGQQLHTALGEMSQAQDVISLLLESSEPAGRLTESAPLTAIVTTRPSPLISIRTFDSQLAVGGKDKALRNAVELFQFAGSRMDEGRNTGERFWTDALKLRSGNWGLVPAPLPYGSAPGKLAERTSKDFLVSFGLEGSPSTFRRRAIGRMSALNDDQRTLEFPFRQRGRLSVSISSVDHDGRRHTFHNRLSHPREDILTQALHSARAEVIEQEIFLTLIREASSLPTASARVSERLIVLEAAQSTELRFELVDDSSHSQVPGEENDGYCDLIYSLLHVLLLRAHSHVKTERFALASRNSGSSVPGIPPLLQPIIDMLQYRVFCGRIHSELAKMSKALSEARIDAQFDFEAVGNSGPDIVAFYRRITTAPVSGQALLRLDHRDTLRFTFVSPSSLMAHLPQATLPIHSIPQFCQLLTDEVQRCILSRICEAGTELSSHVQGTWFVDMLSGRSVGRWDGCAASFAISFEGDFRIVATGTRTHRVGSDSRTFTEAYYPENDAKASLFAWARESITVALSPDPPVTDVPAYVQDTA